MAAEAATFAIASAVHAASPPPPCCA